MFASSANDSNVRDQQVFPTNSDTDECSVELLLNQS